MDCRCSNARQGPAESAALLTEQPLPAWQGRYAENYLYKFRDINLVHCKRSMTVCGRGLRPWRQLRLQRKEHPVPDRSPWPAPRAASAGNRLHAALPAGPRVCPVDEAVWSVYSA